MELFSYLSVNDLANLLKGEGNIGELFANNDYRISYHKCKPGVNYIRLFDKLEDVEVYQDYNKTCKNPEFEEGGVIAKVSVPSRLLEGRDGNTVYLVEDKMNDKLDFKMVKEYLLNHKNFKLDNIKETAYDKDCSTPVESLKKDLDIPEVHEKEDYVTIELEMD